MREIVNAIFYVLRGGVARSLLPKDFPPWPTAYRWFARFRDDGTWERVNHHLVMLDRERVGLEASPTAAVLDSQSGGQGGSPYIVHQRPETHEVPADKLQLLGRIRGLVKNV